MPELPEVETTRRGIEPHLVDQKIRDCVIRQPQLRWPIPDDLPELIKGEKVLAVKRRAKYVLIKLAKGCVVIHLGMSGSLRLVKASEATQKHDHVDIVLSSGQLLRYHDPRRFGAILWLEGEGATEHKLGSMASKLLVHLGPEPIETPELDYDSEIVFDGAYLYERSRGKTSSVKTFIMDSHVVVGVGNIYANEALFMAGISPKRQAGKVSKARYEKLVEAIKFVLMRSVTQGGTTLRDFVGGDGKPGYFQQQLQVYGRGGESCRACETILTEVRIGQRSTVFCKQCQR